MKLEDYRNDYYSYSTKASEIARHLSFAGIALIWIFKNKQGGPLAIPTTLLWPSLLLCLALALDLLHAVLGTFIWGMFSRYHERIGTKDLEEIDSPAWFNWPALVCFWGKLASVIIAYIMVFRYILSLLRAA